MTSLRLLLSIMLSLATCSSIQAKAQCSAPTQPGVRICAPTQNSTTVYTPAIEVNSTPASGAIHKFIIYDNGRDIYEGQPYQTGIILYDFSVKNGTHNLVVNAWDTGGHLLQSRVTFVVTGQGFPLFCSAPSAPGINFCVPPANGIVGASIPVSATAKGISTISSIQVYLDGTLQTGEQGNNYLSTAVSPTTAGKHRVTMVATDTTGHKFSSTKTVTTAYDYENCPPKGNNPCSPGFVVNAPTPDEFVGNSFSLQAQIANNPNPITTMKVYLDSTQVAQTSGPTMYQTVSTTVTGTHILTFQAWDTAGHLYRVQQNVNINVPH